MSPPAVRCQIGCRDPRTAGRAEPSAHRAAHGLWTRLAVCVLGFGVAACSGSPPAATLAPTAESSPSSALVQPEDTATADPPQASDTAPAPPSPTLTDTPWPERWQDLPVIPTVSETARAIYRRGLELGNRPDAFSKVGDCQNVLSMFLAVFDDPRRYRLGEYESLQEAIDHFAGSWSRESEAVRGGFNAASILSPFWADPEDCESGETPLACEIRLHRPSLAVISLETWWEGQPERYELHYRAIIEYTLSQGVVPILATKADNLEGEWAINQAIARMAREYDVPLWNFWAAVQPLPGHGLLEDGFHLTFDLNYFDEPGRMLAAWPWRNLTALQAIDAVWRGLSGAAPAGGS